MQWRGSLNPQNEWWVWRKVGLLMVGRKCCLYRPNNNGPSPKTTLPSKLVLGTEFTIWIRVEWIWISISYSPGFQAQPNAIRSPQYLIQPAKIASLSQMIHTAREQVGTFILVYNFGTANHWDTHLINRSWWNLLHKDYSSQCPMTTT